LSAVYDYYDYYSIPYLEAISSMRNLRTPCHCYEDPLNMDYIKV